jgi:hypothetical protein
MLTRAFLLLSALSLGCAAQAASPDEDPGAATEEAVQAGGTYFSVERDTRKCPFPTCGGFFVTSLQDGLTRCADGALARTCHVRALALLDLEPQREVVESTGSIVLGTIDASKTLTVRKAWRGDAAFAGRGNLFVVTPKDASSYWALRLGLSRRRTVNALDLSAMSAKVDVAAGPILAGSITTKGTLTATQAFTPVTVKAACGADLDAQIVAATTGLSWPSESDHPVFAFSAKSRQTPLTAEQFRALVGASAGTLVEQRDYAATLDARSTVQTWMDDGQIATAKQFQSLRTVLEANLKNLQVFRVGTVEIKIYVVGTTSCGDLAGVQSTVIET